MLWVPLAPCRALHPAAGTGGAHPATQPREPPAPYCCSTLSWELCSPHSPLTLPAAPPWPCSPPRLALTAPKQLTQHSSLESPCTGNEQTSQLCRISRASPGPQRAQQQQAQPGPGPASAGDPRLTPLRPSSSTCRDAAPRASSQPHGASLPQSWSCAQTPGGVCEAGRGEGMAGGWGISLVWTATG